MTRGYKMRKVITIIFGILLVLALVLTGLKSLFNSVFDDFKAEGWTMSHSAEHSRQRGVLIAELISDPSEPAANDGKIRFAEAWIEEKSLSTHRFAWFPYEDRTGEYLLYYSLAEYTGKEPLLLIMNDKNSSGLTTNWGGKMIEIHTINGPDFKELRLSAMRAWTDTRAKNIRFVAKP